MSDIQAGDRLTSQEDEQPAAALPGARLAARRQELGLGVEQVANQLNLAPRQIQAIESDNYSALPGMASVKGFIRAYAKLLGMDPAPLLTAIATESTPLEDSIPLRRALPARPFTESRLSSNEPSRFAAWVPGIAALVLLAAGVYAVERAGWITLVPKSVSDHLGKGMGMLTGAAHDGSPAASADAPAHAALPATAPSAMVPAPAASAPAAPAPAASAPAAPAASAPAASAKAGPAAAAPAAASAPAAATQATQTAQAAADSDQLQLKFREDSWIEVRKVGATKMMAARMVKAGSVESFTISAPVVLTVGNASGVDATLRGAPLDLRADAKTNVARLNLK